MAIEENQEYDLTINGHHISLYAGSLKYLRRLVRERGEEEFERYLKRKERRFLKKGYNLDMITVDNIILRILFNGSGIWIKIVRGLDNLCLICGGHKDIKWSEEVGCDLEDPKKAIEPYELEYEKVYPAEILRQRLLRR